jgi:transposase-like protein
MSNRLSAEAKEIIIKKVVSGDGQSMREIALANNIGCSTLHGWVQKFKANNKLEVNLLSLTLRNINYLKNIDIYKKNSASCHYNLFLYLKI